MHAISRYGNNHRGHNTIGTPIVFPHGTTSYTNKVHVAIMYIGIPFIYLFKKKKNRNEGMLQLYNALMLTYLSDRPRRRDESLV